MTCPAPPGTVVGFDNPGEFGGTYFAANGLSRGFYVIHGRLHTLRAPASPARGTRPSSCPPWTPAAPCSGTRPLPTCPATGSPTLTARYTTFRDPHQAGTGPQAGTVIYSANSDGVVAGAYTYTDGTAKQFPYAHGFIARPDGPAHSARAPRQA